MLKCTKLRLYLKSYAYLLICTGSSLCMQNSSTFPAAGSCPAAETACSTTLLLLCILPTLPALNFLHFWEKLNDCDLRISYFARKIRRAPCYSPFLSVRKTALKPSSGLNQALHTSQARGIRTTWVGKRKTNKPAVQNLARKAHLETWLLLQPLYTSSEMLLLSLSLYKSWRFWPVPKLCFTASLELIPGPWKHTQSILKSIPEFFIFCITNQLCPDTKLRKGTQKTVSHPLKKKKKREFLFLSTVDRVTNCYSINSVREREDASAFMYFSDIQTMPALTMIYFNHKKSH